MLCLLTIVQRTREGVVHTVNGKAGGAEEEPSTTRGNSIPGTGASPSDRRHHPLHTNHTSLRQQKQEWKESGCKYSRQDWMFLHWWHDLFLFFYWGLVFLDVWSSNFDSVVQWSSREDSYFSKLCALAFNFPIYSIFICNRVYQCVTFELCKKCKKAVNKWLLQIPSDFTVFQAKRQDAVPRFMQHCNTSLDAEALDENHWAKTEQVTDTRRELKKLFWTHQLTRLDFSLVEFCCSSALYIVK